MQDKMTTEAKKPETKHTPKELKEKEKHELTLLVELARIYYDGP